MEESLHAQCARAANKMRLLAARIQDEDESRALREAASLILDLSIKIQSAERALGLTDPGPARSVSGVPVTSAVMRGISA